jgi:alginate O-acetyltransferase complex protein AlgI
MVFSDPLFVFGFLPIFLFAYWIVAPNFKNILIFLASLWFYYYGEPKYVWVLLLSIVVNYSFGVAVGWLRGDGATRVQRRRAVVIPVLTLGILFNLVVLLYFKYVGFFVENLNALLKLAHVDVSLAPIRQVLPLGVSFFTFQGISYLVDVYRGDVAPTRSLLKFATYKILFPQLIAGPIVRYAEVAGEMGKREVTSDMALEGVRRFVVGFAKKVLIADTLAACADQLYAADPSTLSPACAWLAAIAYSMQIYFDFSAYSDMAIGMGRMMGFHYPENFNHPYISSSIREFWRRWHMTLSFWFRDYLYRPLGGNRAGVARTYFNLLLVFATTGFWHGASWTFVIWGLWHGLFMMIERRFPPEKWPVPTAALHVYTLLVVVIGWVMFRADNFALATGLLARMFFLGAGEQIHGVAEFATPLVWLTLAAGAVLSTPVHALVRQRLNDAAALVVGSPTLGSLFLIACSKVLSGAYSPFLYFRF